MKGTTSAMKTDNGIALSSIYTRFTPFMTGFTGSRAMTSTVFLDEDEVFVQLCANSVLLRFSPGQELFTSLVHVSGDTFFRLRRSELRAGGGRTVWLDERRNVGIRFRVGEKDRRAWVPMESEGEEDSEPTKFVIEYEEVLVRSAHLLSVLEEAEEPCEEDVVVIGRVSFLRVF